VAKILCCGVLQCGVVCCSVLQCECATYAVEVDPSDRKIIIDGRSGVVIYYGLDYFGQRQLIAPFIACL